jgi:hypothetical protein
MEEFINTSGFGQAEILVCNRRGGAMLEFLYSFKELKCTWRLKICSFAILPILILIALLPMAYAAQSDIVIGPQYIDRDGSLAVVLERTMDVALVKSDIQLKIDGRIVGTADRLLPFKDSGEPMAIALCIDVSGSMRGGPLLEIQQALNFLVTSARKVDRFALVSFADDTRVEASFDKSRNNLLSSIRALAPRGRLSRIQEALNNTIMLFERSDLPARRRIFIISDGKDEGSRDDIDATILNFQRKAIVIDAVGRGKIDQLGRSLQLLTDGTGGQFEHAIPERLSVKDALQRIYAHLLEARSLVAYFDYPRDPSGVRSADGYLIFDQNGQAPMHLVSPVPVPRSKSSILRYWPIFLMLFLVIALTAFLVVRSLRGESQSAIADDAEEIEESPPLADTLVEETPEVHEFTRIAGYFFPPPEKKRPTAVLMGIDGTMRGRRVAIDRSPFHIGASDSNDLCIDNDDYVSREHAYIQYQQGSLFIFDCGSSNATYVNRQKVADAGVVLNLGDNIRLGQSVFEIMKGSA